MAHRPAQQVGLRQAEPGQLVGDAQHLFLVEDHAEGFIQQRRQRRVQVLDRLLALEAAHEGILQPAGERTGAVERQGGHDVIRAAGVDLAQGGAHARAFDLEAADRAAALHPVGGGRVIDRESNSSTASGSGYPSGSLWLDELRHIAQHGQAADAQQVDLDQPQRLDRLQVELGDDHTLAAGAHHRHQVGQRAGRDDHAAGMDREMARQLQQGFGIVEDALVRRGMDRPRAVRQTARAGLAFRRPAQAGPEGMRQLARPARGPRRRPGRAPWPHRPAPSAAGSG